LALQGDGHVFQLTMMVYNLVVAGHSDCIFFMTSCAVFGDYLTIDTQQFYS